MSGRFSGEDNFFSGRMASKESGARWEIEGDQLTVFASNGVPIGVIRGAGGKILFDGPAAFPSDADWGSLSGALETGVTGAVDYRIHHGVIYIRLNLSGSFAAGTTELFKNMPTALRPHANMFAAAFLTSGNTGRVFARSAGTIAVAHQSGGARAGVQGTIIYPLI